MWAENVSLLSFSAHPVRSPLLSVSPSSIFAPLMSSFEPLELQPMIPLPSAVQTERDAAKMPQVPNTDGDDGDRDAPRTPGRPRMPGFAAVQNVRAQKKAGY